MQEEYRNIFVVSYNLERRPENLFHWSILLDNTGFVEDENDTRLEGTIYEVKGSIGFPETYYFASRPKTRLYQSPRVIGSVLIGSMPALNAEQRMLQLMSNVDIKKTPGEDCRTWMERAIETLQEANLLLEGADKAFVYGEMKRKARYHLRAAEFGDALPGYFTPYA